MEIKVSVYQFRNKNDNKEWVIAKSRKQAVEFYNEEWIGLYDGPVRKLSEKELQKFTIRDFIDGFPQGKVRTLIEAAQRPETEIPSLLATQDP